MYPGKLSFGDLFSLTIKGFLLNLLLDLVSKKNFLLLIITPILVVPYKGRSFFLAYSSKNGLILYLDRFPYSVLIDLINSKSLRLISICLVLIGLVDFGIKEDIFLSEAKKDFLQPYIVLLGRLKA